MEYKINRLMFKLTEYVSKLKPAYSDNYQTEQVLSWLLQKLLSCSAAQLALERNLILTEAQLAQLDEWVRQIVDEHKPVQYILGDVPFLDLEILVEPPILIPRPETEWWVDQLIKELAILKDAPLKILDLCSGSGCIGLSLAKYFSKSEVVAVDISAAACSLIQKNLLHNQLANVKIFHSDLFQKLGKQKFDLIVANPPYVPQSDYYKLDPSVRQWEDQTALVAPENDLSLIYKIIDLAPAHMQSQSGLLPQLWIEIDASQGIEVESRMRQKFNNTRVLMDQFGRQRVVIGW